MCFTGRADAGGMDMIPMLSNIYTQTLGSWALWLFYVGAIATLYGTIFATTAAQTRMSRTCAGCSAISRVTTRGAAKRIAAASWSC